MGFLGILDRKLLAESASVENVTRAMDNHSKVIINYRSKGKDEHTGSRVIEPVAYGLTKAGNPVIRAYQVYGDSSTRNRGWKFFRLDRISYWEETSVKFDRVPDMVGDELNQDGDDTMSVVIKTYSSTVKSDATNAINSGPKTKEKVYAATKGDRTVNIGASNLNTLRNGAIYVDLQNNQKANNQFRLMTKQDKAYDTGPRVTTQDELSPRNISLGKDGSVENGDISQEELDKAREAVYSNPNSEYMHTYTPEEWEQIEKDMAIMNRKNYQNKDLSVSKRKYEREHNWEKAVDRMFKNRKGSMNRELYNMGVVEPKRNSDYDDEIENADWFDFGNEE